MKEQLFLTEREWRYVKKYRPESFTTRYGPVEQYRKIKRAGKLFVEPRK